MRLDARHSQDLSFVCLRRAVIRKILPTFSDFLFDGRGRSRILKSSSHR